MATDAPLLNLTESTAGSVMALFNHSQTTNTSVLDSIAGKYFDRYEFLQTSPGVAVPLLVVLFVASVFGTFGNILIVVSVATTRELQNVESIFLVNLAFSDLYVTMIADPMSIIGEYRLLLDLSYVLNIYIPNKCLLSSPIKKPKTLSLYDGD